MQAGTSKTVKLRQGVVKEEISVKPQSFGYSHVTVPLFAAVLWLFRAFLTQGETLLLS